VLCGAGAACLLPALPGCSVGGDAGPREAATPTAPVGLGPAAAVPVGGAKLFREQRLVVSRPSRGTFRAFGAVCTHRGCVLSRIEDGEGVCDCHGSRFDVADGAVLHGPATRALPRVPVRVEDGRLVAGPE
jgi:Rieske Fe-S protein